MILLSWKKKALMPVILFWTVCICGGDFMHGIYAVPVNETDIARVKELGFTYMHCYLNPYTEKGHDAAQKQLDLAEKYGVCERQVYLIIARFEKDCTDISV